MTGDEDVGVFIWEKFGFRLAQAIFKTKLFLYQYPNILNASHSSYLPAYEDGTECSETLVYNIQTPGSYPE